MGPAPAPNAVSLLDQQLQVIHQLDDRLDRVNAQLDQVVANQDKINPVMVVDIRMDFGSMVVFMVKWALASIPAVIILFLIGFLLFACSTILFASLLTR
ncbi:MAG: hypothetical protein IT329_00470 [Caldilineaceae bacterium]|nr:hypothetical protein [Caldilineaceae bacterium]